MAQPHPRHRIEDLTALRAQQLVHPSLEGLDDDSCRCFLDGLSDDQFASVVYRRPRSRPLVQPRGGFPTLDKQRRLSLALREAGSDLIPLTIDSHTRHNDYGRAELLLSESEDRNRDLLNGYPLVTYGYEVSRDIYRDIECPVSLRHGSPDARLLVENAIAAGITEIEGGALCYTLPYASRFPLDRALLYWQYVDRLCAEYSTSERPLHRESFGPLTATLVPPMIVATVEILELLLAAEQGVTSFSVSFSQTGSIDQDIALSQVLRHKARQYLDQFGFESVEVGLVYHQWMGAFPADRDSADHLISASAAIAGLLDADKIITKTRDEAFGIPTIEANARAVRQVVDVLESAAVTELHSQDTIDAERELIAAETDHLLEAVFALPEESLWSSVLQAVRHGLIDVPFAPHNANANRLLALRDTNRAIRVQDVGNVPLPRDLVGRERELLHTGKPDTRSIADRLTDDIMVMA